MAATPLDDPRASGLNESGSARVPSFGPSRLIVSPGPDGHQDPAPRADPKPCTLPAWKGTDAGYPAARWPAAMVQPPAATSCPPGPVTSNWHRVPATTPVTCTSSSVPHGRGVYRTAAQATVT